MTPLPNALKITATCVCCLQCASMTDQKQKPKKAETLKSGDRYGGRKKWDVKNILPMS